MTLVRCSEVFLVILQYCFKLSINLIDQQTKLVELLVSILLNVLLLANMGQERVRAAFASHPISS